MSDVACIADSLPSLGTNPEIKTPARELVETYPGFARYYENQVYTKYFCFEKIDKGSAITCGPSSISQTSTEVFGGNFSASAKIREIFNISYTWTSSYSKSYTFSGTVTPGEPGPKANTIRSKLEVYQKIQKLKEKYDAVLYDISGPFPTVDSVVPIEKSYGPLKLEEFVNIGIYGGMTLDCGPAGEICS